MGWLVLAGIVCLVTLANIFLKKADGFTHLGPLLVGLLLLNIVNIGFAYVYKFIPMSTAFVISAGSVTALLVLVGWWCFEERVTWQHMLYIALIIIGCIGLKMEGVVK